MCVSVACTLGVVAYASLYMVLVVQSLFSGSSANVDFTTLAGIIELFKDPGAVFAGWIHYIVFDLFTGYCFNDDIS